MAKGRKATSLVVQGSEITVLPHPDGEYISLTDMVKNFEGGTALIEQWMRNKDTVLFLGVWEKLHNPIFNSLEFEGIKNEAGRNSFFLSVKKWIETTKACGLMASSGRYGGTYAHHDIAFEFGSWLSPEFKLYLITEFQRLKSDEGRRLSQEWNLTRALSKLNYRIHTDAIKAHLIPVVSIDQISKTYADEADVLNVALFGKTAKQWREENIEQRGNIRDAANIQELLVMTNLESMNAEFIRMGLPQQERLKKLNEVAVNQLKTLLANVSLLKISSFGSQRE